MPSILLINDNKIVSRLLQLSSQKHGYNLEEVKTLESSKNLYDVIFIDSDRYSDELIRDIESKFKYGKLGYIGIKQGTTPDGFDIVIEKPFLPTDFVDVMQGQVIGNISQKEESLDEEESLNIESLDIDDEADVLLEEGDLELDNFDDVEDLLVNDTTSDEISLDDLDSFDDLDLSLDPTTVMTTGVAASMVVSDSNPEELADMVYELDDMKEDEIKSVKEEISLESEPELTTKIEESLELESEELPKVDEIKPQIEESTQDMSTLAVGAGVATAVGAVASEIFDSSKEEDKKEEISTLDDLQQIDEIDLQQALGEEVSSKVEESFSEEIISQEITTDGSETFVEMDDMQAWIKDAVQKAITPQMIQEALNGMDINVTLSFSNKIEKDISTS
jgi:uncharacterized membrane protein